MTTTLSQPGRSCPPRYRYHAGALRGEPAFQADTLYVVGGLYGNVEALHSILEMKRTEERHGSSVKLVFNGDFNWFNVNPEDFSEVNETVLTHVASRGNAEAELDGDGIVGCGCNYPAYVDQSTVDYSNQIMKRLRGQAVHHPAIVQRLAKLPMYLTVRVGEERVGIIHGDPESLAGWRFAVENVEPLDSTLRERVGCGSTDPVTTQRSIRRYFEEAGVHAFASTHTCLPFAQDFQFGGERFLVINNGAAGMPNFRGVPAGIITRISARLAVPADSLYGTALGSARFDAIPVYYDQKSWLRRFLKNWPPGSAGYNGYISRLEQGPEFCLDEAVRGGVQSLQTAAAKAVVV
ncbi:MAG: metallophosphatase family protein [Acidiferrobacterales bacterium]